MLAVQEGLVEHLLDREPRPLPPDRLTALGWQLAERAELHPRDAEWIVESWAWALGLLELRAPPRDERGPPPEDERPAERGELPPPGLESAPTPKAVRAVLGS